MPELAEVEFYRKQWGRGCEQRILTIDMHLRSRVLREVDATALRRTLTGAVLLHSEAHGKQMFFRFTENAWLGVHLGMTGKLSVEQPGYAPGKHDHLILHQRQQSLVFTDARQFGRVRFHVGDDVPAWRANLPAPILSPEFTQAAMEEFLERHGRMPIKAALLLQAGFPGIGNWMADEILWRARIHPARLAGKLRTAEAKRLFQELKFVCGEAMRSVGEADADPPAGWLFHERWGRGGKCPRHGVALRRAEIGGRTTCWCRSCQKRAA
ncbi:MAG TPA: DNA-formamidopyrimidine glycosylase family protein [Candidatus Acidoferrales bacterium]|nr:DNA-formamidopyrimidine glycosylase family protein [Candidatus Acidoferrales bacterium]